ncbi:MAG: DUF1569 domain-containing protein [bacterium]|nr:DUF1569 domain-containing protein [bacterium]
MFFARTAGRRTLRFENYDDLLAEIERLAPDHRTLARWSLAQICHHLADTQDFSIHNPKPGIKTTPLYRATVGRFALRVLLWFHYIPEGAGNLPGPDAPGLPNAIERLQQTVTAVSTEPMTAIHPIFGRLTQEQWRRFHLIHAAHHLSFAVPGSEAE